MCLALTSGKTKTFGTFTFEFINLSTLAVGHSGTLSAPFRSASTADGDNQGAQVGRGIFQLSHNFLSLGALVGASEAKRIAKGT